MLDIVEKAFDIGLDNIAKFAELKIELQVFDRFFGTPIEPVAVACVHKVGFKNR